MSRFLRLSLLIAGTILSALVAPVVIVPVHAAGSLYIDPSSQAAQPAGSIVTYQVKVANIDPLSGWDIRVSTTRTALDPLNISLTSNVVGTPLFVFVDCVNGGSADPGTPGNVGCDVNDGPGIAHSAVDFRDSSGPGTSGVLFTIKFRAGDQSYSQLRFLDDVIVNAGIIVVHTSVDASYGILPGGVPAAQFIWKPSNPVAGDTVSFNASLSHDDPSNSPSGIQSYQWDFHDASRIFPTNTPLVDHIFGFGPTPAVGNFTVTLTITNKVGLVSAVHYVVQVKPRPLPCRQGLSSIVVPGDCPTIKSAIDSIAPGGTIHVAAGVYNESLIIDKSLTLTGAGRDLTIIRGDVEASAKVTLESFTLIGADYSFWGVLTVRSPANTLSNLRVEGPVSIRDSPGTIMTNNIVDNSVAFGQVQGLRIVNSTDSIFRSNRVSGLSISGDNPKSYVLDIDQSNTVNGKPVYYVVRADSPSIPSEPGYLGFVDSSNIEIFHRSMTSVGQGVLLVSTRHAVIDGLQVTHADDAVHALNATDTLIENGVFGEGLSIFNSSLTSVIGNKMTMGGIEILGSKDSLVARNKISSPFNSYGYLYGSLLPLFDIGIGVIGSNNNRFADNLVSDARLGILVSDSTSNQFARNRIDSSSMSRFTSPTGLVVQNSPRNIFRNNHLIGLTTSLSVTSNHFGQCDSGYRCHLVQDYIQDIDTSNTVDNRPIFYLVSRRDMIIPSSAAYIGIVNSQNIKVSRANVSSADGILVVSSKNVLIENGNLTVGNSGVWAWATHGLTIMNNKIQFAIQGIIVPESGGGIYIEDSSRATVSGNNIRRWNYFMGINLVNTTYSIIEGNFISNYQYGIRLEHSTLNTIRRNTLDGQGHYSSVGILDRVDLDQNFKPVGKPEYNLIIGNTLTKNYLGISAGLGSTFYQNNFIDNIHQAGDFSPPINTWDNGAGQGNYWSDYKGQDLDHDGVGDTLIPHLGLDKYPLMKPWVPTGLSASFTGRGAWFGQANSANSDNERSGQTVFAKVRNDGRASEWVNVIFNITSRNGSTMIVDTGPVWLARGQTITLPMSFQAPSGTYTVRVQLRFSSDALLSWTHVAARNFTFRVSVERNEPSTGNSGLQSRHLMTG